MSHEIPKEAYERTEADEYAGQVPDAILATFKTWSDVRRWAKEDLHDPTETSLDQAIEALAFRAGMNSRWRIVPAPADTATDENPNLGMF